MRCCPYGEGGVFVDLELDGDGRRAARTLSAIRAFSSSLPHADVVAGAGSFAAFGVGTFEHADVAIEAAARAARAPDLDAHGRRVEIPVVYDGEDLATLADALGLSSNELVALHAGADLTAEIIGFMPGFAYLSGLPAALHVPRRATPRARVPAGSVAVAGGFSGVYPSASPGGWHLLGQTGVRLFDASRDRPALIGLGDRVRFVPVDAIDVERSPTLSPRTRANPTTERGFTIVRAAALVTIQDAGRAGRCGEGLPVGGAWDATALACANLAVGNPPGAAALEVAGGSIEFVAAGDLDVSVDGDAPRRVDNGETLAVPSGSRFVRYVAVGGGVATPKTLGSRGSSPTVGLGPAPLRRGDWVPVGEDGGGTVGGARPMVETPPACPTLFVDRGPHWDRFGEGGQRSLVGETFVRSARGDRVGVRVEGPRIDAASAAISLPVPMVRGAIEVPPDGAPIVLGPDHPTTGGYPVIAVLRRASQGVLARLKPGQPFRFVVV